MWPRICLNAKLLHRRPKSHSQRHIADSITTKTEFWDLVDVLFAGAATSTTPSSISVHFFVWREKTVQFVQEKRFLLWKYFKQNYMLGVHCALINLYKNTDAWPQRLFSNITAIFPISMFVFVFCSPIRVWSCSDGAGNLLPRILSLPTSSHRKEHFSFGFTLAFFRDYMVFRNVIRTFLPLVCSTCNFTQLF